MRISDWSADVCSSDRLGNGRISEPFLDRRPESPVLELRRVLHMRIVRKRVDKQNHIDWRKFQTVKVGSPLAIPVNDMRNNAIYLVLAIDRREAMEIGRASCRERVCQ